MKCSKGKEWQINNFDTENHISSVGFPESLILSLYHESEWPYILELRKIYKILWRESRLNQILNQIN